MTNNQHVFPKILWFGPVLQPLCSVLEAAGGSPSFPGEAWAWLHSVLNCESVRAEIPKACVLRIGASG